MEVYRKAKVYVDDLYAGILQETDDGYEFFYDETYLENSDGKSVSLTLPLSEEKYISRDLIPFFDGLIPEGWLLEIAIKNWKLDRNDRFGLLLATCKDSIGDISIVQEVCDEG